MKTKIQSLIGVAVVLVLGIAIGIYVSRDDAELPSMTSSAFAAGGRIESPTAAAPDRYVYYPGTEKLKKDEIRVVCCGSGMPAARHAQAACSWLIECGNGEKLLFDLGTGSMANVAALMIPYQYLDKVFLSHLHTDHFGDIDALWAGGWTAGRPNALRVWGPSGATPEMGTKYAMDHFLKSCNWDYQTRAVKVGPIPGQIETTEFDYKGENIVVYDENDVMVRSWPAIHAGDGPVSFSIEYDGLKVVFGGDTFPNKWFIEHGKNADIVIHETFGTIRQNIDLQGWDRSNSALVSARVHTAPEAFGKVMSRIKPRMAVAYHFFNDFDISTTIYERVRKTYDGPLSLAVDYMVWNITSPTVYRRRLTSLGGLDDLKKPNTVALM